MLKGRFPKGNSLGYEDAKPQKVQTNRWSSCENNSNNSWNVNFGNGNLNNNNKYNSMRVRPVSAVDIPKDFLYLICVASFEDCRVHKSTSADFIDYLAIKETDLPKLAHELYTKTYKPGVSICFLVKYPKLREVFAASFRDRIVHHFISIMLTPLFEEHFARAGNVTFNCRKGFGTLKAQQTAFDAIRRITDNYQSEAYIYRGDIVGFFMNIDIEVLWSKLYPFVETRYKGPYKDVVLYALRQIVYCRPERNCIFNSPPSEWAMLPANKSLFRNGDTKGMPIGNLTTQLFANFYMTCFDEYAQSLFPSDRKKFAYVRFVDDFLIVCSDKGMIKRAIPLLENYLARELRLQLHRDKYYFQKASHGVKFVGAVLKNSRTYLSNRTVGRFEERVKGFKDLLSSGRPIYQTDLVRMQSVLNSYLGFCKSKRTYFIRKRILGNFGAEFFKYFYIEGRFERVKMKRKYKPIDLRL